MTVVTPTPPVTGDQVTIELLDPTSGTPIIQVTINEYEPTYDPTAGADVIEAPSGFCIDGNGVICFDPTGATGTPGRLAWDPAGHLVLVVP